MAFDNPPSGTNSDSVPLGARVDIFPAVPMPDYNASGGPAFAAKLKGNEGSTDLMAILCNTGLPARLDFLTAMRSIDHPGILRLIDSAPVLWPQDNTRYYAFAMHRPLSPRLKQSIDERHHPMSEDAINTYFVTPLIGALAEFQRTGVVHNGIRPTNIFWRLGSATPPQFGECLSAPAGYNQPVLFEPLERAFCSPIGRGPGIHVDDCYAFGMTLALMFLGQNPFQGMDDNAIIQAKMNLGTFGCVVGNHRLPATHIELLRGLLADDSRQRWSAAELEQWLSGRRLTPKSTDAGRRAARAFNFYGKDYYQARPLAAALAGNVVEAVKVIENSSLDKWLRRALNDEDCAERLIEAQASLKTTGKSAHFEDQVVARCCMALDPPSPIRYRGVAVMPLGIADMLVEAVLNAGSTQLLAEIISSQLVTFWIDMQKEMKTELVPLGQQFERMKGFIEKTSFGNGLERVIYELKQGLPCLSPILRSQYVTAPKMMLPAFERLAVAPNRPREPMDRHIAAFLIVRDRRNEMLFEVMNGPESSPKRGVALLTLLSEMQNRHGPDALPALAQWVVPLVDLAVQRYLSKSLKEKIRAQMKEATTRGDLGAILRLVDDPRRIERDQQEFMAARMLYLNTMKEINLIESRLNNRDYVTRTLGKPLAATISMVMAILLVMFVIIHAVWQAFTS